MKIVVSKRDSQGVEPESPFQLRDLTGLTHADVDHNPCVDIDASSPDFRGDLSGLWLYQVKSAACQKSLPVHFVRVGGSWIPVDLSALRIICGI